MRSVSPTKWMLYNTIQELSLSLEGKFVPFVLGLVDAMFFIAPYAAVLTSHFFSVYEFGYLNYIDWRYLLGSLAIVELDVKIFKFKTDQNGKEYFDPIKCQNRLMIWSYSQKVSTLKQKKESTQQQIWFPFLAVFSPLIASFTRKKERGIESIMAPEASVSPLRS